MFQKMFLKNSVSCPGCDTSHRYVPGFMFLKNSISCPGCDTSHRVTGMSLVLCSSASSKSPSRTVKDFCTSNTTQSLHLDGTVD